MTTHRTTRRPSAPGPAGAILSNPVGIACGSTCTARFVAGAEVTLIATPAPGARFAGWDGPCANQGATCTFTLATPETITATFEENRALQAALGLYHTCVLLTPGVVRCFGEAAEGQLGYGDTTDRGDGIGPAANAADVPLNLPPGVTVTKLVAGAFHTCVLLSNGALRCWGQNTWGQLGYGDRTARGNTLSTVPHVDVPLGGATAEDVGAGSWHTCVRLTGGSVRCWGRGTYGILGVGSTTDQLRADGADVAFAGAPSPTVTSLAVSAAHTCALLSTGRVRCWGRGLFGVLGYGNEVDRGDTGATAPIAGDVSLGSVVIAELIGGISNTCALLDTGALRCWGHNAHGQLGRGNTSHVGDDAGDNLQLDVPVGAQVLSASLGTNFCARVAGDRVRCWGENGRGQLGLGDTINRGDGIGPGLTNIEVPIGAPVAAVSVGTGTHACAILVSGGIRCWGPNDYGQLGYGDRIQRGDGVGPGPNTDVPIF
ncbi:hypothetical protein L6R52_03465 [Myxococcota bacterium]|nr:hypothetical protein [Myxococcota bacterium]